jgi:4-aminobutyrate aminotransferase
MTQDITPLSPVWTHLTKMQPVRGEGIYLYDATGIRYTDFTCGIGVTNTGHCHPKIVKAICGQAQELIFGQINTVVPPATLKLAEHLRNVTPPSIDRFFFANSGAEAVEASVKLARAASGRRNLIVFQGSFHGRTHQAMAMTTSKYIYRHNYQPLPGGIFVTPFPNSYYYGWDEEQTVAFCLQQLDLLFKSQTAPDETAAIIIEPVLGEGGYVPSPDAFLRGLRAVCDQHGILLVLDEVQSGIGRTGKFFCFEYAGIEPDIIIMGKGLASGMPMSGIAARSDLMDKWTPGTHGGTYGGGNAVVSAAASATIEIIREENLVENATAMGRYLMEKLNELQSVHPLIGDVRGRGLMVGVEFSQQDGSPAPETAKAVQQECLKRNLFLHTCGSYGNVIRWIPPLVVTQEQIDGAIDQFREALQAVVK